MNKKFTLNLILIFASFLIYPNCIYPAQAKTPNPFIQSLKDIEFSSRLKFEYDNNVFLKEKDKDSDFKEVFSQSMTYKFQEENHYFQLGYKGNYTYFDQEATGILGHAANVIYSYRPFNKFSFGIRDDYSWLQDSKIASTIGDRVLSLGYIQNTPSFEAKYEIQPGCILTGNIYQQLLDAFDSENDDYIDNKRFGFKAQLEKNLTAHHDVTGFVGIEHKEIKFEQVLEKSSVAQRTYLGILKKFANFFNISTEVGFENIDMNDERNADDSNVDAKAFLETVYSIFTKMRLSFDYNIKKPSLRREYTQYASTVASLNVSHSINPKTSLSFNYSFEKQHFKDSDALVGQARDGRSTDIREIKLSVIRKLNSWLACETSYDYNLRNTDFASESYGSHIVSVALTARY